MSSYHGQTSSKTRTKVKPILRKLTQSEKNSLDLDRPAAEQDGYGGGNSGVSAIYEYGQASRSSHDVVFHQTGRRGYHNRSTSGTSQFSTASSFVHPFQQTPRPYTPPVAASYQNSMRDSEPSRSPALTEDDDPRQFTIRRASDRSTTLAGPASPTTTIPTLRIQTKPSASRLALATSNTSLQSPNPDIVSPVDTMSPSSLRPSIDKGFRIRSRSEVDTRGRSESIQEARRKFQERELAKEEKAAREEIKQLEKKNQKEARIMERNHRTSSASEQAGTRAKRSRSDLTKTNEKTGGLFAQDYNSVPGQNPPFFEAEAAGLPPRRAPKKASSKHKTHSAWTKFMMWLRTRFLRMKR